eukprot:c1147_g1_i2 orf=46-210(-)
MELSMSGEEGYFNVVDKEVVAESLASIELEYDSKWNLILEGDYLCSFGDTSPLE